MSDAPDKVLLKFEGDASGVARAAAEAKAHLADVSSAAEAVRAKSYNPASADPQLQMLLGGSAGKPLAEPAEEAKKAGSAFDQFAKSLGTSEREARIFRETIGRVTPELGALLDVGIKAPDLGRFFSSSLGQMSIAGVAATIGLVSLKKAIVEVYEETVRARREFESFMAEQQKFADKQAARTEDVADTLAKAGIFGEAATNKGAAIERRMMAHGYKQEAIRAVLPLAVTDTGEQAVSDEELEKLVASQEFGGDSVKVAVKDARHIDRVRERALSRIGRMGDLPDRWVQSVQARMAREGGRVQQFNRSAIASRLGRMGESIPEGEAGQAAIEDIVTVAQDRIIGTEEYDVDSPEDRLRYNARASEAGRRAMLLGLMNQDQLRDLQGRSLAGQKFRSTLNDVREHLQPFSDVVSGAGKHLLHAAASGPGAGSRNGGGGQPANVQVNYGTIYQGGPGDVTQRAPRVGQ